MGDRGQLIRDILWERYTAPVVAAIVAKGPGNPQVHAAGRLADHLIAAGYAKPAPATGESDLLINRARVRAGSEREIVAYLTDPVDTDQWDTADLLDQLADALEADSAPAGVLTDAVQAPTANLRPGTSVQRIEGGERYELTEDRIWAPMDYHCVDCAEADTFTDAQIGAYTILTVPITNPQGEPA